MTRRLARLVLSAAALTAIWPAGADARSAASSARAELVSLYSPVVMLRTQQSPPCDNKEEQYRPTTVGAVLGDPGVELVDESTGERTTAPTLRDIAGLDKEHHLDLPGDPLTPGCDYAEDFAVLERAGRAPPTTYAHIAREKGHEGLVVQYWFFYYFNQFNDLHEGDWEGMQIAFPGDTAVEALEQGPDQIALFQHGGGERADWNEAKVQKEGETHPIVYPAAGSHATFYDDAIYIENGQGGSGLGCDNTTEPLTRYAPRPVLVPTEPAPGSDAQWLTYLGRWGQQEEGFNHGPQGPITKSQWREPFTWMEGVGEQSPKLPGRTLIGPAPASAFCAVVADVAKLLNLSQRSPLAAAAIVFGLVLLVLIPILLTRWRPASLEPLRQRRAVGQLLRVARQFYGRHWRPLVAIGLTAFPVIAGIEIAADLVGREVDTTVAKVHIEVSGPFGSLGRPLGFALVAGAVIALVRRVEVGKAGTFRGSYGEVLARFGRVLGAQLAASLLVALLALTVIGLPFAILKYVHWQFVQQKILFEDSSIRDAFRGSTALVRGHWWYTARAAGVLWLISVVAGPILGFALLFTSLPPEVSNVVGAIVFALLIPYVAVGRTLLYFGLGVRDQDD